MPDPKRKAPAGFVLDGEGFYDKKRREERYKTLRSMSAPGLIKWDDVEDGKRVYVVEWYEPAPAEAPKRVLIN